MDDATRSDAPLPPRATGTLLLRGSVMQFAAFSLNFAAGFFLMPFLIHALGERGYGLWAIIGTIVGQLGILDAGLMSTTQRFIADAFARNARDDATAAYSTSMVIFLGLGTLVFSVVLAIAFATPLWLPSAAESREFEGALVLYGLNLALLFPFAVMQGALAAKLRSDATAVPVIVCTVIRTALAVVAIELGYGMIALALGYLVSSLIQRSMLSVMLRKYVPEIAFRRSQVSWKKAKELVVFGRFVFLLKAADGARYRFSNLIIAPLAGIAAVTHFAVAIRLVDYYQSMIIEIVSICQPIYAGHFRRGESNHLRQTFLSVSRFGSVICSVFAGAAIAFGRPFLKQWLGASFDDSFYALAILVTGMFFALLQSPSRDVLRVIYKHAFDARSNLIELAAILPLTLILIPPFGIVGAALGTAIPMIVVKGVVLPHYVCRHLGLSFWVYYREVGRSPLVTLAVTVPLALMAPRALTDNFADLIVAGVVYAGLLTSLLIFCLPQSDKASLVGAIGRHRILRLPGGETLLKYFGAESSKLQP